MSNFSSEKLAAHADAAVALLATIKALLAQRTQKNVSAARMILTDLDAHANRAGAQLFFLTDEGNTIPEDTLHANRAEVANREAYYILNGY